MIIAANILGIFIFMFIYWRRLKDEYSSESVFSTLFTFFLLLSLFLFISFRINPSYWFWLSFAALLSSGLVIKVNNRIGIFEILDAFSFAIVPWLILLFTSIAISNNSIINLIWALVFILILLLYKAFESRYKHLSWYKSGKIGFLGLISGLAYFLIRGILSLFLSDLASLVKYDFLLSFFLVIIIVTVLVLRARER